MAHLRGEARNDPVRERLARDLLVRLLEDEAILEFAHNHHLRDGILEPGIEFLHHVVDVGVDEPVELVWVEPEPGRRLQKAVGAAVGTSAGRHKLPELEADDARALARATEASDEAGASTPGEHGILSSHARASGV